MRSRILQSIESQPLEFKAVGDANDFDFGSDEEEGDKDGTERGEWDSRIDISAPLIVFDRHWINRLVVNFGNREFLLERTIAYDVQAYEGLILLQMAYLPIFAKSSGFHSRPELTNSQIILQHHMGGLGLAHWRQRLSLTAIQLM